eukprot:TRINITY_DN1301_c0_g2_i10.p1 TRINITY_DN1301_c0_g2~~TRINITY_DN1301_c0_g2_i10.p1  ORF type:complete len:131 (+),score=12.34 TRINITY_DN1301_c0_g2_i10:271-663(+)
MELHGSYPTKLKFVVDCSLSGIASGMTVILLCSMVERFGGVTGGIIGSVPSTVVVVSVVLFSLEPVSVVSDTMNLVPLGMLVSLPILLMWRFLPPYLSRTQSTDIGRLGLLYILSVVLWFFLCFGVLTCI